jgi:DNA replicative helicase MCM subunit Mcm2 (Cdc46/Mcm family)
MRCLGCSNLGTMVLIHNRCIFANKQQIKMQETPDAIPEAGAYTRPFFCSTSAVSGTNCTLSTA